MKTMWKTIACACAAAVLAGCTQAYYDQKRAAAGETQPVAAATTASKPSVTKDEVTKTSTNVASAAAKGSNQFGDWLRKQGINIKTQSNPDGK